MSKINLPVGISNFKKIREDGYYYIDKTNLIQKLLVPKPAEVTLFTRPRRFGKTLGMNMLAHFFDIQEDSRKLFQGLKISENRELCENWMNQYPVVLLSFKNVDGLEFETAYGKLESVIAELYKSHYYLKDSEKLNEFDKDIFYRIAAKKADTEEVMNSLFKLTHMLNLYYGKPVILLLDEYDVPVAKANANGYYEQMLDMIRGILGAALKDNTFLKFAIVTGCLRITKESIFTGLNNFTMDTIQDSRYDEFFGFTQAEVDRLLEDASLILHAEEMKAWYDGYRFGDMEVYCPWDVVNHVDNLLQNPEIEPIGYWKNSSDNAIIRSFIDYSGTAITQKFETLLSGGYIIENIQEDITYNYLHSSEENLWSILYFTGYLTRVSDEKVNKELPRDYYALKIPNKEIKEIFETTIKKWFTESTQQMDRKALFASIWNGDDKKATTEISKLLRRTISYYDYREDFYHAFFAGIFAGAGYVVQSNKEHGEGRSDIIVQDYAGDRLAVFEVKYSRKLEDLEADCEKAISQIDKKMYAEEFQDTYAEVICYGIAFYKKRCKILKK
ncbi:MAG: AAA family ATPase [Eubacteriales bacterium]|nr:AAA family ATPase [Eubacteriales bacterium]